MEPEQIKQVTAATLAHYERSAQQFFDGTRDHDVSQNIAALLDAIGATGTVPPFRILTWDAIPGAI